MGAYCRDQLSILLQWFAQPLQYMIVVTGPRQTGKTTLIRQALEQTDLPSTYVRGDEPAPVGIQKDATWLVRVWEQARQKASQSEREHILVLDEIQRIAEWSSAIKGLWDNDRWHERNLRVVVLGSSPLLMQKGLSESMAGRFETVRLTQWSYSEMAEAFDFDLDQYLYFGGYPGAAPLIRHPEQWRQYVQNAIIETNIERDIVERMRIQKPAVLKQLFEIGSAFSSQIVSYHNLLLQLNDKGNISTLAHYLDLLSRSGLLAGLHQYAGNIIQVKRSSPKLQVLDAALMTANSGYTFGEAKADRTFWGHLTESAIGAHICNSDKVKPYYWRQDGYEVDFVICFGQRMIAVEVKSGKRNRAEKIKGLEVFEKQFQPIKSLIVGTGGISIEDFLSTPVEQWFQEK